MAAESSGETDNEAQLSRASSFTSLGESLLPPARKRKARDEDLSAVYAFAPCASRRANIGGGSFQSGGGAFEPLDEAVELVGKIHEQDLPVRKHEVAAAGVHHAHRRKSQRFV